MEIGRIHSERLLALFDLDGTLFDTGDVNYYAYKDALEPYEIKLDKEYFVKHCNGRHYTEFLPELMGDSDHIESVHEAKRWRTLEIWIRPDLIITCLK